MRQASVTGALAAAFAVAGCGGGSSGGGGDGSSKEASGGCKPGPAVAAPSAFNNFPFPVGTVITKKQQRGKIALVEATAPGSFEDVDAFYKGEVTASGYQIVNEKTASDGVDTTFFGLGQKGTISLRAVEGCSNVTAVSATLRPGG